MGVLTGSWGALKAEQLHPRFFRVDLYSFALTGGLLDHC
jgi:hypothetical protein